MLVMAVLQTNSQIFKKRYSDISDILLGFYARKALLKVFNLEHLIVNFPKTIIKLPSIMMKVSSKTSIRSFFLLFFWLLLVLSLTSLLT